MFARLRRRLVLVNVAIIAAIVIALAAGILLLMDRTLMDQQASELHEAALSAQADLQRGEEPDQRLRPRLEEAAFFVLWPADGGPPMNPQNVDLGPLAGPAGTALHGRATTVTVDLAGTPVLVESTPLSGGDGSPGGALQVGRSLQQVRDVEGRVAVLVVGAGALGLILALGGGWLIAERSLVPIRRAFERQREFTADASHDLRTPLSVVDAGLQLLGRHPEQTIAANDEVLTSMADQVRRMDRVVDGLLTLARADSGTVEIQLGPTDLDALARTVVEELEPLATRRGATLEAAELAGGTIEADADRLHELLSILVDNALLHGGHGVHVSLAARRTPAEAILEVADDGPGIAPDQRGRVLERFYRLEESRSMEGSGLGLAIADWIVGAHRGRLELLDNAAAGRGLVVRLSLPLTAAR